MYLIDRFSQFLRRQVVLHFINTWDIKYPLSRNFYVRTCVKFTFANKIEAMCERSHVQLCKRKSRNSLNLTFNLNHLYLASILFTWLKFMCINVWSRKTRQWKSTRTLRMCHGCFDTGSFELDYPRTLLAVLHVHRIEIPYRAIPERVGPRFLSLESVDYFGTTDHFSDWKKKNNLNEKNFKVYWKIEIFLENETLYPSDTMIKIMLCTTLNIVLWGCTEILKVDTKQLWKM